MKQSHLKYADMQGLLGIDYKEVFSECNADNYRFKLMPYLYYGKNDKKHGHFFPFEKPKFYFKDGRKYIITHFVYFLFDGSELVYIGCSTRNDRLKFKVHKQRKYTDWAVMPICDGNGFYYEHLLLKKIPTRDNKKPNS